VLGPGSDGGWQAAYNANRLWPQPGWASGRGVASWWLAKATWLRGQNSRRKRRGRCGDLGPVAYGVAFV